MTLDLRQQLARGACVLYGARLASYLLNGITFIVIARLLTSTGLGELGIAVIVPTYFAATANVIEHIGGKPVFADIDLKTLNIDPQLVEEKITSKTKAIMPVHFAGLPCDLRELRRIAETNNLALIEDAAHAFGAEYDGRKIGYSEDAVCFSFYPTKNMTTIEGGVLATNNSGM